MLAEGREDPVEPTNAAADDPDESGEPRTMEPPVKRYMKSAEEVAGVEASEIPDNPEDLIWNAGMEVIARASTDLEEARESTLSSSEFDSPPGLKEAARP